MSISHLATQLHRRASQAAAIASAIAVATVLLVPLPAVSRAMGAVEDLGHVVLGGLLTLAFDRALPRGRRRGAHAILVAPLAATAFLGVLEIVQSYVGRDGNLPDALRGAAGSFAAAALFATTDGSASLRARAAAATAAGVLLVAGCWDSVDTLLDRRAQLMEFPLLGSFESRAEIARWEASDARIVEVPDHATDGRQSLRVDLMPGPFPGVSLSEPPEDWRGYDELQADAFLEGDSELMLTVRITDARHDGRYADRFNGPWRLRPGPNQLRVPLSAVRRAPRTRDLDLGHVSDLVLFATDLPAPRAIFLDHVRLVRAEASPSH